MIDCGCACSRILWAQLKFSKIKMCVGAVYYPTEGDVEERVRFWNYLDRVEDRVGNGYRLCVTKDLN